jgi:hypothetical protein
VLVLNIETDLCSACSQVLGKDRARRCTAGSSRWPTGLPWSSRSPHVPNNFQCKPQNKIRSKFANQFRRYQTYCWSADLAKEFSFQALCAKSVQKLLTDSVILLWFRSTSYMYFELSSSWTSPKCYSLSVRWWNLYFREVPVICLQRYVWILQYRTYKNVYCGKRSSCSQRQWFSDPYLATIYEDWQTGHGQTFHCPVLGSSDEGNYMSYLHSCPEWLERDVTRNRID